MEACLRILQDLLQLLPPGDRLLHGADGDQELVEGGEGLHVVRWEVAGGPAHDGGEQQREGGPGGGALAQELVEEGEGRKKIRPARVHGGGEVRGDDPLEGPVPGDPVDPISHLKLKSIELEINGGFRIGKLSSVKKLGF